MDRQQLIDLMLIVLFGGFFVFGLKTGTVPGLGGPVGLSFDRYTQPRRFWLLMAIYAVMVAIGAAAALGLVA